MVVPSEPKSSDENALNRIVTPGTILDVIAELREAADETLALAANLTDATSIADLKATAESLQRDVIELEEIAAFWCTRSEHLTPANVKKSSPTAARAWDDNPKPRFVTTQTLDARSGRPAEPVS